MSSLTCYGRTCIAVSISPQHVTCKCFLSSSSLYLRCRDGDVYNETNELSRESQARCTFPATVHLHATARDRDAREETTHRPRP